MAAIAWEIAAAERVRARPVAVAARRASPTVRHDRQAVPAGVYRRRRRVAVALAVVAVLTLVTAAAAAGAALGGGHAPAVPSAAGAEVVTVVVGPGETLWDLVRPHTPAGADAGGYVAAVAADNDLDPRALTPGTVVRLPR